MTRLLAEQTPVYHRILECCTGLSQPELDSHHTIYKLRLNQKAPSRKKEAVISQSLQKMSTFCTTVAWHQPSKRKELHMEHELHLLKTRMQLDKKQGPFRNFKPGKSQDEA